MKKNYYQDYKNLHDSIKPIRGRACETRPIGERRRDWELIEMDGPVVACVLYQTQVVRYYPDGRIGLQCGGWQTPSTADFIHAHSPWQCFKRNNKLWVMIPNSEGKYMHYPIPREGELTFQPMEHGRWEPASEVVIQKLVVNREKAKEARAPYQPFLQWAKTFMKLSDGWIMHETRKSVFPMPDGYFNYREYNEPMILEMASSGDDAEYVKALCVVLWDGTNALDSRIAETIMRNIGGHTYPTTFYDMQFSYELLKSRIYRMADKLADIHDKVPVQVMERTQSSIF